MTAKRPTHRLLRSLPLAALTAGLVLTACDVASTPEPTAARLVAASAQEPAERTVIVQLPRDPAAGTVGFSYGMSGPVTITPGQPLPTNIPTYWTVRGVVAGSSAERAGIRRGDVILAVNGVDSREPTAWKPLLDARPGTEFTLRLHRGGEEFDLTSRIDPRPEPTGTRTATTPSGRVTAVFGYGLHWPEHMGPSYDRRHGMQPARAYPIIDQLDPNGSAAKAGLRDGDVLLAIDGNDSRFPLRAERRPGDAYEARIRRDGRELTLQLTMDARKER
jgi:S1-C subfamily serine protease